MKKPPLAPQTVIKYLNQLSKAALLDIVYDLAKISYGDEASFDADPIAQLEALIVPVVTYRRDKMPCR